MKRSMPSIALSSKTNENRPVFARSCFKTIIFNLVLRVYSFITRTLNTSSKVLSLWEPK